MSQKPNRIFKNNPKRPELRQVGTAVLFKRKDMLATDAWGVSIYLNKDDGTPNYDSDGLMIWKGQLKELMEGKFADAQVFELPRREQKE